MTLGNGSATHHGIVLECSSASGLIIIHHEFHVVRGLKNVVAISEVSMHQSTVQKRRRKKI
jgi:hypothetical protein